MVDSLEMGAAERDIITYNCKACKSNKILITHGTDKMVETAGVLSRAKIEGKTIVLTGAMIPIAFGTSSDGFFNLGSALAFAQLLPPGVFIAMNGKYFEWDKVVKNLDTGYFQSLE